MTDSILRGICGYYLPHETYYALEDCRHMHEEILITALNVCGAHFSSQETLHESLCLSELTALTVQHCGQAVRFLNGFAQSAEPPKLKSLTVITGAEERRATYTLGNDAAIGRAMSRLVRALTSLQSLVVIVHGEDAERLPQVDSVCVHAATLRFLYLDNTGGYPNNEYYSASKVASLYHTCTAIEELTLRSRKYDAEDMIFDRFGRRPEWHQVGDIDPPSHEMYCVSRSPSSIPSPCADVFAGFIERSAQTTDAAHLVA